ncbi:hypothetical protein PPTG_19710, partial [Phytophthora nicotianae INRA-310]
CRSSTPLRSRFAHVKSSPTASQAEARPCELVARSQISRRLTVFSQEAVGSGKSLQFRCALDHLWDPEAAYLR